MTKQSHNNDAEPRSVLNIMKGIKSGSLSPHSLEANERQACVGYLLAGGASIEEITQLLNRSDRTIRRDRKAIQVANALEHDPQFAGLIAGRLVSEAELCMARIRRVTRDKEAPHAVRVEGERACFLIFSEMIQRLQNLGYLPTAAHQINASITHSAGEIPSFDELEADVMRLREFAEECPLIASDAMAQLVQLHQDLDRAKISWGHRRVKNQLEGGTNAEPNS